MMICQHEERKKHREKKNNNHIKKSLCGFMRAAYMRLLLVIFVTHQQACFTHVVSLRRYNVRNVSHTNSCLYHILNAYTKTKRRK